MQDETPCKDYKQLIKLQSSIQDIIGALNEPLNDHYKFNGGIFEEPLGPLHEKLS